MSPADAGLLQVADHKRREAGCVRGQVGAAVRAGSGKLLAASCNGLPTRGAYAGAHSCAGVCPRAGGAPKEACVSEHAELRALLATAPADRLGGTIAVTRCPCVNCAKAIVASGVSRVVFRLTLDDMRHFEDALRVMVHAGLDVEITAKEAA